MNGFETAFLVKYALTFIGLIIAVGRLFYMQHAKDRQERKDCEELIKWRTSVNKDLEYLKRETFKGGS